MKTVAKQIEIIMGDSLFLMNPFLKEKNDVESI